MGGSMGQGFVSEAIQKMQKRHNHLIFETGQSSFRKSRFDKTDETIPEIKISSVLESQNLNLRFYELKTLTLFLKHLEQFKHISLFNEHAMMIIEDTLYALHHLYPHHLTLHASY
ncbi:MAG: hypothetical protein ACFFER_18465 [Candidatus Thorarchaeota archaeon]